GSAGASSLASEQLLWTGGRPGEIGPQAQEDDNSYIDLIQHDRDYYPFSDAWSGYDPFNTTDPTPTTVYQLWPTVADMHERMQYTPLQAYLLLDLPDGLVPDMPCAPMPYDLGFEVSMPMNLGHVVDQKPYYPGNANEMYGGVLPLLFANKGLHQILKLR